MDIYATAVRRFMLMRHEEGGDPIDSKALHVKHVDSWRKYRLYDAWIDGRDVDPANPPVYILVDGDCNVRWMTKEEAEAYQRDMDFSLKKAVMWMEHQMRKE